MTEWLTSGINEWVANMWLAHYDPFYFYIAVGLLIIIAATWLAWFFDILRPLAGAISVGVVAFLFGMRKGQYVEQDRQKARDKLRDEVDPRREIGGSRWPW